MQTLESLIFFFSEDGREVQKFTELFHRPGYLYGTTQRFSLTNAFVFSERIVLGNTKKKKSNPLLSKSTLKYLVYYKYLVCL